MKILQLSYSLRSGGGERFVVDLCNRLSEDSSNEVVLVTIQTDKDLQNVHYRDDLSSKVRYINLDCKHGLWPSSLFKIYKVIKKESPDIVHAHCNVIAILLSSLFLRNPKYVHTLHSLANVCLGSNLQKPINKWFYKHLIKPITISNECHNSYRDLYNSQDDIQINNGREPLFTSSSLNEVKLIVNNWKASLDAPVFIHVARIHPLKNQKRLFDAFEKLYLDGIKFHLMCLGAGYDNAGYVEKYKTHPQIHIIGEKRNVGDYMSQANFFVMTSDFEGLPLSLLEAMSMGVIPISTPAGGIKDVIINEKNGYITQGFELNEFVEKIRLAVNQSEKISSQSVKKFYERNFSMKVCADKYYYVYKHL